MPFKSEKQRRFLWSQHPDIAKRWAKEYPGQKNLPLYAHDKKPDDKEKAAAMTELNRQSDVNTVGLRIYSECVKKANSGLLKVDIPHSDKPVAAGDEHVTAENQGEDNASPVQTRNEDEVNQSSEELAGDLVNNGSHPLLKKLAVVLSQPIMQAIENEKAEQQARMAAKMPQNAGIKRYATPAVATPMPMGMQQPAQPAPTPAQQPAQPQQQGTGMNSPSANPINSFGALSTSGNINGNAAFGTKNSPDSSKSAAASPAWQRSAGKNEEGGLNAKGRASYNKATGGNLKAPVTESNPSGDRAKRQNSFCSRMCGMKSVNTGAATAKDPDSRINKSLRKWNCKCSALHLYKTALEVTKGGLGSRALASTIGHLGAFPMMTLLSPKSHVNPNQWEGPDGDYLTSDISADDTRAQKLTGLAKDMERANPEELKDHRVYLGGGDFFRELPRIFKNPRTSLVGKAFGTLTHPLNTLLPALTRGSMYNPFTNSTYLMGNKPGVLTHELGHAIDFNSGKVPEYSDKEHPATTWFKRQGKGLGHDLYTAGRMPPLYGPFHALGQEERANTLSENNLRKTYENNPEALNKILDDRQRILPAGIGSYVGNAAAPFLGPAGYMLAPTVGALAGKVYGVQEANRRKGNYAEDKPEEEQQDDGEPATIKMPERSEKKDDKKEEEHRKAASQLAKQAGGGIARGIARAAEENGLSPEAAMAMGLLGAGGVYGAYYGGKKLLAPSLRRMNLRTLPEDEVGRFSLPMQADNKQYPFAERYREPGMLGGFFMNDDATNISDALIAASKKSPGMAGRLEDRSWTPQDLDLTGRSLVKQYPDRYRLPTKSASQLYKSARPLGLDNYSSFAGPDQIQHAVQQYGQLKALVRPDDNMLKSRGLNRGGFQSSLRSIARHSQDKDRYDLSELAPNPNLYAGAAAGLGLLGTAGLGYMGGMDGAGVGLAGTGAGVAAAYMHAVNKRKNILNTAKLMKEYGLLKPKLLQKAYPLLADDYKVASVEAFAETLATHAVQNAMGT
jgi:hypothetical protein